MDRHLRRLNTAPPASQTSQRDANAAKEESAPEATPEAQPAPSTSRGPSKWGSLPVGGFGKEPEGGRGRGSSPEGSRSNTADWVERSTSRRSLALRRASTDPRAVAEPAKNETLNLLEAGLRQFSPQGADGIVRHMSIDSTCEDASCPLPALLPKPRQSRAGSLEADSVGAASASAMLAPESPAMHWLVPQLLFAIGLGALLGLTTVAFHVSTVKIEEYLRRASRALAGASLGQAAVQASGSIARAVFGAYMACGTFAAASLVSWVSQRLAPECVGGGTIATKICLAVGSPVPLRVGAWRFVLSAIYVGAGNVLGIEAPTLHLCAAVASALHHLACLLSERLLECFSADVQLLLFTEEGLPQAVVLGCAAGLSAAFGSPMAAISYAVEEYVDVRQTGMVTALVLLSSLSAALVSRGCEPHTGPGSLSITSSGAAKAGGSSVVDQGAASTSILPWLLVATVIGLALGTLSHVVMTAVLKLRSACQARCNIGLEIGFGALAGLLTGALSCAIYVATACDSAWGLGQLGTRSRLDDSCNVMQGGGTSDGEQAAVALLLSMGKLLSFGICFATGGAGGVLMPSLVIGTSLGRCIGLASSPLDSALPAAGPVLGMAAFFSANMRLPLTAAGVALECATAMGSYDPRLVCTIPLASALGTWVAAWWDPCSIFERMMMQDGINPFTLSQQIRVMLHGSDGGGLKGNDRPTQQRRDSSSSLVPGPLAPPALPTDSAQYGESQASARIVMAARRRSILAEFRLEPSSSFISSPDEFLFASRSSTRRVHPHGAGHLGVLPSESPKESDIGDHSDSDAITFSLSSSLFPGVSSRRSSRMSSASMSDASESCSRRSSFQEQTRPSCRSTSALNTCQPSSRGTLQRRSGAAASGPLRTDTPDSVPEVAAPQMPCPTLLGTVQTDPKAHAHH